MKVHVEYRIDCLAYAVFLYHECNDERWFLQPDGSELHVKQFTVNQDLKPTFQLDCGTAPELIEALQRVGVQPKQLTKIEGQFEAQGKHLADLQAMLRKAGKM